MQALQPDIVRQRAIVSTAETLVLEAMDFEMDAAFFGTPSFAAEAAEETRHALDVVERQRAILKQMVHQTTHSLARFFLEIDANSSSYNIALVALEEAKGTLLSAKAILVAVGPITLPGARLRAN